MKIKFNTDILRSKSKKAIKKVAAYTALATAVSFFACTAKNSESLDDTASYSIETSIEPTLEEQPIDDDRVVEIEEIKEEETPLISPIEVIDTRKAVAITFDDGPGIYTDRLVDILKENDCKATFFVLGCNVKRYPDSIKHAYDFDNEIGIHGYTHKFYTDLGVEGTREEIVDTYNLLRENGIEPSQLVRPPGGKKDETIVNGLNYSFILWSVDTRDWESRNKDKIKEEILNNIEEGSIILLHDIHECSVDAVEEILPELTKEYRFVTISELFDILDNDLETCTSYRKVKVLK